MRWLAIICLLAVSPALHADPALAIAPELGEPELAISTRIESERPRAYRYLVAAQLAVGAADLDNNLEFATSWSLAAGRRLVRGLYVVGRLRHTSPWHGSLAEDAVVAWATDSEFDASNPDERRIHQTELAAGLRITGRSVWAEALFGGQLRYQIGGAGGFDNRALWTVDAAIGAFVTDPQPGDSFRLAVFAISTFEAHDAPRTFCKGLLGLELTADLL